MTSTGTAPSLLLTHDFPPMGGGIARAMGELARHASPAQLVVSTGRQNGSESFDATCPARVDRLAVPSERLRHITGLARWAWRAKALVRETGADFVWAGNLKPAGHVARWLSGREAVPYGLIVYGLDLNRLAAQAEDSAMKRRVARGILRNAAGIVAISEWTATTFRSLATDLRLPAAAERVRVVRLGVDTARFRPAPDRDVMLAGHRRDRRRWAITVARLVPHKGVDIALAAVAELVRGGADVGYLVAGDGPERAGLEQQAERLGIGERVRWLGAVEDAELSRLLGSADFYLGLSRQEGPQAEGFGLALLEAQASGLPVIAGRSGGMADAVSDGVTGLLVPPTDLAAIVAAARRILEDDSLAAAMGRAGRERAEREFGWARVLRDLDSAAREFTAAAGAAARAGR